MLIFLFSFLLQSLIINILFGIIHYLCIRIWKNMDKLKRRKLHEILFQNFRKNLFDLPRTVLYSICGIDMVVYLLLDYRNTSGNVVNHGYYMDADMIFIVSFLGPLNILWVLRISENKTREIGAGLAWSFYYGYLKITAPYFEESIREAGLEESDVLHKRVVLIPEKDGILDSIEDADHRIEFVRNTPALRLNIAGVRDRSYSQSIYKIRLPDQEFYCVMEFPAVLKTLFTDMRNVLGMSEDDVLEEVSDLYQTLRTILYKAPETEKCIELIKFSGDPKDIVDLVAALHEKEQRFWLPYMKRC